MPNPMNHQVENKLKVKSDSKGEAEDKTFPLERNLFPFFFFFWIHLRGEKYTIFNYFFFYVKFSLVVSCLYRSNLIECLPRDFYY